MPKPDFLGIGTQRAGTTFLHTVLSRHPQIAMPRTGTDPWDKEQHFFNKYLLTSDLETYERQFIDSDKPGVRITGEITPAYAALPGYLVRTMESYLPRERTRIILVIRNPVTRIISSYKLFRRKKGDPDQQGRLRSLWRFIVYAERPGVTARTDYLTIIRNWTTAYGADNLLILSFDELGSQSVNSLRRIARFLGVDSEFFHAGTVPADKVHVSPDDDVPEYARCYLAWRWLPLIQRLNVELEGELDVWLAEMERETRNLGLLLRIGFHVAQSAAWFWNTGKRYRLARRFRRLDERLQLLVRAYS